MFALQDMHNGQRPDLLSIIYYLLSLPCIIIIVIRRLL
jgi:hypothetical protein